MLELARVVAVHPEDHSIDAVIIRTGQRVVAAPVLAQGASSVTGSSNLPPVTAGPNRWEPPDDGEVRSIVALAPSGGGNWIALGFKFPEVNGVLQGQAGMAVSRHISGAWQTIAPDGTMTFGHPSGAVIVFGPNTTPADMQGSGADGRWSSAGPNASAQVGITVNLPSGTSIAIGTDGKVTITAPEQIDFVCPKITTTGDIEAQGDVKAGTISLKNHIHSGVQPAGGNSGVPVP